MANIQAGIEIKAGVKGVENIKKLSAEIEAAGTDTGRLAEQSRELETAFARVSAQNGLIAQYRQLKDELGYTKTALKAARDGLAELDMQMQSGATREQKAAYRDLQRTVRRLEAEQSNLQGRLKLAAADMRDAGISAKDLAAAERRIAEETGQAAAKLEKLTVEAQKMKRLAEAKAVLGIKTDQARSELAKVKQSYADLKASGTQTRRELKQATAAYRRQRRLRPAQRHHRRPQYRPGHDTRRRGRLGHRLRGRRRRHRTGLGVSGQRVGRHHIRRPVGQLRTGGGRNAGLRRQAFRQGARKSPRLRKQDGRGRGARGGNRGATLRAA